MPHNIAESFYYIKELAHWILSNNDFSVLEGIEKTFLYNHIDKKTTKDNRYVDITANIALLYFFLVI